MAGARVARNVRLADMNLDVPVQDARRIEVVCNGLPPWHGEQLAVDATLVSPLGRDGQPRAGADAPASLLPRLHAANNAKPYPELERARRCRLVVFGMEVVHPLAGESARSGGACLSPDCCPGSEGLEMERHPRCCSAASLCSIPPRAGGPEPALPGSSPTRAGRRLPPTAASPCVLSEAEVIPAAV